MPGSACAWDVCCSLGLGVRAVLNLLVCSPVAAGGPPMVLCCLRSGALVVPKMVDL